MDNKSISTGQNKHKRNGAFNLKPLIGIMLAIVVLLAIVIIVTVNNRSVDTVDIIGRYELEAVEGGSGENNFENMKSLGMVITLDVQEDGTGTMDMSGQVTDITYDIETMTMEINGTQDPFTYKDGILTIDRSGTDMVFVRK